MTVCPLLPSNFVAEPIITDVLTSSDNTGLVDLESAN